MWKSLSHALSEIRQNYSSINWWRNRVFVPYVIGTLTRLHPSYPGYNKAIHVMNEDWDNLIILDAYRYDELNRLSPFQSPVKKTLSGSRLLVSRAVAVKA